MDNFRDIVIEAIRANNNVFKVKNNEINIRCPICGDSIKSERHAHLYIRIPRNDDEPWLCFCHRCNYSGLINQDLFRKITGLSSSNSKDLIISFSKYQNVTKNNRTNGIKHDYGMNALLNRRNVGISNSKNPLNDLKMEYINDRLGLNLSYNDLKKYKIILDLNEINQVNHLGLENSMRNLNYISTNYMGFISHDNEYCILRYVGDKLGLDRNNPFYNNNNFKPMRYLNYSLFPSNDGYDRGNKFYIIPNKIEMMCNTLKLNITEGIFDILGVYHHVLNMERNDDTLNVAICGFSYLPAIEYILSLGFINIEFNLYIDADKIKEIKYTINRLKDNPFIKRSKFRVYYNGLNKDFGIRKETIDVKEMRV